MKNTKIYSAERSFDIGCRVIKWDEPEGLDLTPTGKYTARPNASHADLQKIYKQFTIHWSVTYKARHTVTGLKARGLSVNFSIDDDIDENGYATVYQHLDLCHSGWSQGQGFNQLGPGVEIAYMPQAYQADMYSVWNRKKYNVPFHDATVAPVHGSKLRVFLPTEAQMKSLVHLCWGIAELFPNIPPVFPKTSSGDYLTTVLPNPHNYSGFISHYHLKRGKIDVAGLDYDRVETEVGERKRWGY